MPGAAPGRGGTGGVAPGRGAAGRGALAGLMNGLLPAGRWPGARGAAAGAGGATGAGAAGAAAAAAGRSTSAGATGAAGRAGATGVGAAGVATTGATTAGAGTTAGPGVGAGAGATGAGAAGGGLAATGGGVAGAAEPLLGNASLSLRTTGASTVDDALLTNSPWSFNHARSALLSIPNSLASSWTRALPATVLLILAGGDRSALVTGWCSSERDARAHAHRVLGVVKRIRTLLCRYRTPVRSGDGSSAGGRPTRSRNA
jgi:hypothetical protein